MLANADTNFVNAKRYITTKYIFFPHFFFGVLYFDWQKELSI